MPLFYRRRDKPQNHYRTRARSLRSIQKLPFIKSWATAPERDRRFARDDTLLVDATGALGGAWVDFRVRLSARKSRAFEVDPRRYRNDTDTENDPRTGRDRRPDDGFFHVRYSLHYIGWTGMCMAVRPMPTPITINASKTPTLIIFLLFMFTSANIIPQTPRNAKPRSTYQSPRGRPFLGDPF